MLDAQLYGINAGWHHLTNILLHTAASIVLLLFLCSTTGRLWPSIAVAALFAWHPMHVESVAWIAERKDVLSALLMFLMLLAYVRYTRSVEHRGRWYAAKLLDLVRGILGLLAKSMLVTVPCVLLLLDFWPLGRGVVEIAPAVLEKIPIFAAAAIALSVLTYIAQKVDSGLQSDESCPMALRLMNIPVAYVRYIAKLLCPVNLSVFYPYRMWAAWQVGGAVLILVVITIALIMRWRRGLSIVGWFWFWACSCRSHRARAGGHAIDGGSVQLSAFGRAVHHRVLCGSMTGHRRRSVGGRRDAGGYYTAGGGGRDVAPVAILAR